MLANDAGQLVAADLVQQTEIAALESLLLALFKRFGFRELEDLPLTKWRCLNRLAEYRKTLARLPDASPKVVEVLQGRIDELERTIKEKWG